MESKWKNYAMILISAALLVSVGLNFQPDANYYCDSKAIKAYCGSLSSTGKTCYVAESIKVGSKLCDEGWKPIPSVEVAVQRQCSKVNVIAYTDKGKYFCDGIGIDAKCIKDQSIEMPFVN